MFSNALKSKQEENEAYLSEIEVKVFLSSSFISVLLLNYIEV